MKHIVILISGRGSNMEAIVQACAAGGWPARIAAVISNRPDAAGLAFAQAHGVPTAVVDHKAFGKGDAARVAFDAELQRVIDGFSPDLVVLAGFMRILGAAFVRRYEGRMLNIHPSLLPAFTGLHTHRRAIEAGDTVHGASVHFVTPELDGGPVVIQATVPVLPGDDESRLAARVLTQEHVIYPTCVGWYATGRLQLKDGVPWLDGAPLDAPIVIDALHD